MLDLPFHVANEVQQATMIVGMLLLSVSPAFEEIAHGHDNPPARACFLQDEQNMSMLHIAHAQAVCSATAWQSAGLQHARETARHVEISAIRHAATHKPAHQHHSVGGSLRCYDAHTHAHRPPTGQGRAARCLALSALHLHAREIWLSALSSERASGGEKTNGKSLMISECRPTGDSRVDVVVHP